MARIVSIYSARPHELSNMSYIRWYRMAAALASRGHQVTVALGARRALPGGLRSVSLTDLRWDDYDVVKVSYDEGFETLERFGGADHRFIISRWGTVVGSTDRDGIPFRGSQRERIFAVQERAQRRSRVVAVLNDAAKELWVSCFGESGDILVVPGAVDRHIPPRARDPFAGEARIKCLFAGNLSSKRYNPTINASLVAKLNAVGRCLFERGAALYVMGPGAADHLDPRWVTYLGAVPYKQSWDYLRSADVGLELIKHGRFMHNNESSKIYHYLRAGLPTVSEAGLPNNDLITAAQLGCVVASRDPKELAAAIVDTARGNWDRQGAVEWVLRHHTWDHRAAEYERVLQRAVGS